MNFTASNKALILIHKEMEPVTLTEPVNVMLTPQFYTLKKEILPLKYAHQAKRIAPSLFDGLLETGKHYSYMVWKEQEAWMFLAYDLEMIVTFLQSKGFALEYIAKLYFAQEAVTLFEIPLVLSPSEALVSLDGVAVLAPTAVVSNEQTSSVFDTDFIPKRGVMLEGAYGSMLSLRQALMFAAVFVLFATVFFVEGLRYGANDKEEAQMQSLLEAHPSLQSSYTRDSILAKYKTLDAKERKKRDTVKTVASMIFKGVTLVSFGMDDAGYKVHFSCKDAQIANRVKVLAAKYKMKTSAFEGSNDLKIEGAL